MKTAINRQETIARFFGGRQMVLASMHRKELVLRDILEEKLGVELIVPQDFDTDDFGTFTGEVQRTLSPLETARQKCLRAMELTGHDLAIASEGSFGAHPTISFLPACEEVLLLVDKKHGIEIKAKVISTQTNFAGNEYYNWDDVKYFAAIAGFPSHGLIVRREKDDVMEIHKSITSWQVFKDSFNYFHSKYGKAYVETDMRAMYNPTRMKVIKEAAEKLIKVAYRLCPQCATPGFDVKRITRGLPCAECGAPTETPLSYTYACRKCNHSVEARYPENRIAEEALFCNECNP
jgi:hypothetical protein